MHRCPSYFVQDCQTRPAAKISSESSLTESSVSFFLDFFLRLCLFLSSLFSYLSSSICIDFEGSTGVGSKAELQEHRSESSSVNPPPMVSDAIYPE